MRVALDCTQCTTPHDYGSLLAAQLMACTEYGIEWVPLLTTGGRAALAWPPGQPYRLVKGPPNWPAGRYLWYRYALPRLLRQAGVQASIGLHGYISTHTGVPQLLALYDRWHAPAWHAVPAAQRPSTGQLTRMLAAAHTIYTDYAASVPPGLPEAAPRWHYTGPVWAPPVPAPAFAPALPYLQGHPYFVCPIEQLPAAEVVELLLAFSAFKKRMQCSLRLVLIGTPAQEQAWQQKYNTYRYRDALLWLPYAQVQHDWHGWLQGAWALLLPHKQPCYRLLLDGLQAGTALVCHPLAVHTALAGTGAYYISDAPGMALHQHMMALYKDEAGRRRSLQLLQQHIATQQALPPAMAMVQQLQALLYKGKPVPLPPPGA